ncbi:MAG: hypothetical protein A3H72_03050 [Candidatus Doudnabacteria bacterium RIFCSPLOWO2_02_FULL_48_8]|uniref:Response regulatory domain-containing protein n=1 Tax=Candidatus Doudnabacteria bacterium RIFCSPHIGHO2_01_FULL_46_24 TaxID=1817825 RepID=A0A1F5NV81_9BACT|nr:MAG: hypothetical protein A2720_00635 [Candidatus Doudnabacteria bacterium RIFCSPHIGHO2_01_FULL_46_24]OGE95654.1 MAG: hypothetical protein A3H72_03050 [Candidatus Doudnabacteria bacterium RIFCSPLOWO2_02_FULL_48_8]OGE95976.1 MAG: hypothetical protein A3E98_04095 [Candidatus Doudnabacteria bacterium RIFCSPHIGHO2_12_FULL_48_11]
MREILFVHPDEKLLVIYQQKLKPHFKVHSAVDGLSAVRKIRLISPQAVISEYRLPLLSGKALVRFVRSYSPTATIPFIFFSQEHFDPQALNLGANDWLSQQTTPPDVVIEKIHYHLGVKNV